jgi:hypothetical protein
MLSRDQILNAKDSTIQTVPVPEWGGAVGVRVMSGKERDAFERRLSDQAKLGELGANMRAALVASTVVDEQGNRLFTEEDIEALGKKNWAALERITRVSTSLNLLSNESVETTAKN